MEIDESDLSDWLEGRWNPAGFPERSDIYRPGRTGYRKNGTLCSETNSVRSRRANRLRDRDEENLTLLLPVLGSVRLTPEAWLFLARKFAEYESLEAAALAALNHGGLGVWMNSEKKSAVLSARDSRIPQAKALGAARLWDDKKILAFLKNSA